MTAVLHVISDRARHRRPLVEAMVESAKGGAQFLQLRDKKAPALETFQLGQQVSQQLALYAPKTKLLINDRLDLALALEACGVHLAAKSLPVHAAVRLRRDLGWHGLLGCSVHSLEEALTAQEQGADYVTFGHIYSSESHRDLPPKGVYALAHLVESLTIPVIAIGGIDATNIDVVLQTRCSGVAVIGAVLDHEDPQEATRKLLTRIAQANIQPKIPFTRDEEVHR